MTLAKTVNRGHAALLSELRSLKSTDRSFPYWLCSASLRFCVALKNVKLEGKLIHVDDLEKVVKEGFQQMKLSDLSKKERDHAMYCLARFTKLSDEKSNKSTFEKFGTQACYDLRSKRSIAKKLDDLDVETKASAPKNLKTGKTPRYHAIYCPTRFTKISDEKSNKGTSEKFQTQSCYDLLSKRSIVKKLDDPELENKASAPKNLKTGKTPRDLQAVTRASTPLRVTRN